MPSFGIIAEGVTDQVVIEAIVAGFFGDDDPDVRRVRPPPSETGRGPAVGDGGWGMVLKEVETGRFAEALDSGFFTHLIVQIDTDVSEQKGYDVPWREGGRELSSEELVTRVVARLRSIAGEERFDRYRDRLLFAVSVHSIECWLLPLFYTDNKRTKVTGCADAVNKKLKQANKPALSNNAGEKFPRAYEDASRGFEKRDVLLKAAQHNAGFLAFVTALGERFPEHAAPPP